MDFSKSILKLNCYTNSTSPFNPYNRRSAASSGSGFFYKNTHLVMTCYHVVRDAVQITVVLASESQKEYNADLLVALPDVDIALLCLKTPISRGVPLQVHDDSVQLLKGDSVVVLGYPLGTDQYKYTTGVLSGTSGLYLTTDAAVNPGNSGGPILCNKGREGFAVVGLLSRTVVQGQNYSFASPVRFFQACGDVQSVINKNDISSLYTHNEKPVPTFYRKCDLGFRTTTLSESVKQFFGIKVSGVCVQDSTYENLPNGLILTKYDGRPIDDFGYIDAKPLVAGERKQLCDYMPELVCKGSVAVEVYSPTDKQLKTLQLDIKYPVLRQVYQPHETFEWLILGDSGVHITELTQNHLSEFYSEDIANSEKVQDLVHYSRRVNKKRRNIVFISHIEEDKQTAQQSNEVSILDIVTHINQVAVDSLENAEKAFHTGPNILHTKKGGLLLFEIEPEKDYQLSK